MTRLNAAGSATLPLVVRREAPGDADVIRHVHTLAFARHPATGEERPPGPIEEAVLIDDLRDSASWIPQLSLVAEHDGEIVAHCVCSRGWIDPPDGSESVAALGLGPIGVLPSMQRSGAGSALMYASIGAADALGEAVICLLGSNVYYPRFGFVRSTSLGIDPPNAAWGAHFQARLLTAGRPVRGTLRGTFRYDPAFGDG